MNPETQELLRSLPSVSALLDHEEVREWLNGLPRNAVLAALQTALADARRSILDGHVNGGIDTHAILARAEEEIVRRSTPSLRRVVNATGVVLHTGLGRAPLCDAAIEAIAEGHGEFGEAFGPLAVDLGGCGEVAEVGGLETALSDFVNEGLEQLLVGRREDRGESGKADE